MTNYRGRETPGSNTSTLILSDGRQVPDFEFYEPAAASVFGLPLKDSILYKNKPVLPTSHENFLQELEGVAMDCLKDFKERELYFGHPIQKLKRAILDNIAVGLHGVGNDFWETCIEAERIRRVDATYLHLKENLETWSPSALAILIDSTLHLRN